MTVEKNKKIVLAWADCLSRADWNGALAFLVDGATWWGASDLPPFPGNMIKGQGMEKAITNLDYVFAPGKPPNVTVDNIIGEGDLVAVEAHGDTVLANGLPYKNRYHWLIKLNNSGKMEWIHEYADTYLITKTMFAQVGES
ncbi:MAG: nuclear transport factor 2 family protein [Dehalococcoidia bacterium]